MKPRFPSRYFTLYVWHKKTAKWEPLEWGVTDYSPDLAAMVEFTGLPDNQIQGSIVATFTDSGIVVDATDIAIALWCEKRHVTTGFWPRAFAAVAPAGIAIQPEETP